MSVTRCAFIDRAPAGLRLLRQCPGVVIITDGGPNQRIGGRRARLNFCALKTSSHAYGSTRIGLLLLAHVTATAAGTDLEPSAGTIHWRELRQP